MIGAIERISKNTPTSYVKHPELVRDLVSSQQVSGNISIEVKPIICKSGTENIFQKDIAVWIKISETSETELYLKSNNFLDLIVHFISNIIEVKQIYLIKESDNIYQVWSVVTEMTDEIKKKIYDRELKIIHYFKENIYFDFHIIDLLGIQGLKESGAILVFNID